LAALRAVGEVGLREARSVEGLRDVVGSLLEESARLARLVDDLLTLCRGDAGNVPLQEESVPLAGLARDVAGRLGVLAEEKRQRLVVEESPAVVRADPRLLRLAVTNLLDNAIRYAPAGSTIRIVVFSEGGRASLAVVDEGPGIAEEHRPHVFERFYRIDPSRTEGGAGLGLAIARWAVEAHGGAIELDSEVGRGSTFRIVLPATEPASAAPIPGATRPTSP
jgi:signal transduction histidine kinase